MTGQRIFITGGASGLGRALAQVLTARGNRVCVGDIDAKALETAVTEGAAQYGLTCDVRKSEDYTAALGWMQTNWGGVDMVILNAGVAQMGPIERTQLEDWQWITDINLFGIVRGVQASLPVFRAQGRGHIVTVASMASWLHLPEASAYNATKAAVVALSETLMLELEPDNITVQVACPSFFRTDLARNMRASSNHAGAMTARMVERARIGADEVAARIVEGIVKGEPHILTHPKSLRMWMMKRLLPFRRYHAAMRKQVDAINARMRR